MQGRPQNHRTFKLNQPTNPNHPLSRKYAETLISASRCREEDLNDRVSEVISSEGEVPFYNLALGLLEGPPFYFHVDPHFPLSYLSRYNLRLGQTQLKLSCSNLTLSYSHRFLSCRLG